MIKNATFLKSYTDPSSIPSENIPEFVFVGKSNVGKSSLINCLVNQKKLARTSSEPGLTRLINYFEINGGSFYFVDLPGYGFAKVSKDEKKKWTKMIEGYFELSKNIAAVFVLIDIRRSPSEDDLIMVNYLFTKNIPFFIIATKADKLSKNQIAAQRAEIANALKIGIDNVIVSSSENGKGKKEILDKIAQIIEN